MTNHWPSGRIARCSLEFKCDKCPTCLAHTHHLDEHKCDKLIALLYARTRSKSTVTVKVKKGGAK